MLGDTAASADGDATTTTIPDGLLKLLGVSDASVFHDTLRQRADNTTRLLAHHHREVVDTLFGYPDDRATHLAHVLPSMCPLLSHGNPTSSTTHVPTVVRDDDTIPQHKARVVVCTQQQIDERVRAAPRGPFARFCARHQYLVRSVAGATWVVALHDDDQPTAFECNLRVQAFLDLINGHHTLSADADDDAFHPALLEQIEISRPGCVPLVDMVGSGETDRAIAQAAAPSLATNGVSMAVFHHDNATLADAVKAIERPHTKVLALYNYARSFNDVHLQRRPPTVVAQQDGHHAAKFLDKLERKLHHGASDKARGDVGGAHDTFVVDKGDIVAHAAMLHCLELSSDPLWVTHLDRLAMALGTSNAHNIVAHLHLARLDTTVKPLKHIQERLHAIAAQAHEQRQQAQAQRQRLDADAGHIALDAAFTTRPRHLQTFVCFNLVKIERILNDVEQRAQDILRTQGWSQDQDQDPEAEAYPGIYHLVQSIESHEPHTDEQQDLYSILVRRLVVESTDEVFPYATYVRELRTIVVHAGLQYAAQQQRRKRYGGICLLLGLTAVCFDYHNGRYDPLQPQPTIQPNHIHSILFQSDHR